MNNAYANEINVMTNYILTYTENNDNNDNMIQNIKMHIYNLLIANSNGIQIVELIVENLLENKNINYDYKSKIIDIANECKNNLIMCKRPILHLELFVLKLTNLLIPLQKK